MTPEQAASEWEPNTFNHDPQHVAFARECFAAGWLGGQVDAAARRRTAADRYMTADGEPGDLGSVWGWRTIARWLRTTADEIDGTDDTSKHQETTR